MSPLIQLKLDGTETGLTAGAKINNAMVKIDGLPDEAAVKTMIREFSTIVNYDIVDPKKPTRAESITAFKMLPNFDWTKDDTFYIRDTGGANKMCFMVYIADGATDEATAGQFFIKDMNETV